MNAIAEFFASQGLTLTADNMSTSLSIMGQGMLGIFIVIAAIAGVTMLLNNVTSSKKDDNDEE
jgi:hypothetical protein